MTWSLAMQSSHPERLALRVDTLRCSEFKKAPITVPIDELRLILDTQITQEEHSETIIDPVDREELTRRVRSFIDRAKVYGQTLQLRRSLSMLMTSDNFHSAARCPCAWCRREKKLYLKRLK